MISLKSSMKYLVKNFVFVLLIFLIISGVFTIFSQPLTEKKEVSLTQLVEDINQAKVKIEVKQDPARMQKSDVPRLKANSQKFGQLTGWKAKISFSDTVSRVLDYWRQNI